jgi:16S rRNA (uracil1498-N3)-methyltransferase
VDPPTNVDEWLAGQAHQGLAGGSAASGAQQGAGAEAEAEAEAGILPGASSPRRSASPMRLMLSPRATQGLDALPVSAPTDPIEMLIGPEGGLSPDEEAAALAAGYQAISLGHRILRAETAALAMLAAFATRWNGW